MVPSMVVQSEDVSKLWQERYRSSYEGRYTIKENKETMVSYESIFKDGIRKALNWLNSIDQIPVWGKKITYYRNSDNGNSVPLSKENIKILWLPETFDISPRVVGTTSISCMYVILGNRKFSISPDIGEISNISLTSTWLIIEIKAFFWTIQENIVYDKQQKLPDLMWRLWISPRGKGEKKGFKATKVKEL